MMNLPGWRHRASSVSPDRTSCVFHTSPHPSLRKSHPGSWRCRTGPLVGWCGPPGHAHCPDGTLWGRQSWIFSLTVMCLHLKCVVRQSSLCCVLWLQRAGHLTWQRASSSRGPQGRTGRSCGQSLGSGPAAVGGQSELVFGGQKGCRPLLCSPLEIKIKIWRESPQALISVCHRER